MVMSLPVLPPVGLDGHLKKGIANDKRTKHESFVSQLIVKGETIEVRSQNSPREQDDLVKDPKINEDLKIEKAKSIPDYQRKVNLSFNF